VKFVTYRANQLASHLYHLRVGPDQPVGLCVNRSADMIAAMLGIPGWRRFGVPLDPDYRPSGCPLRCKTGLVVLVVQQQTAKVLPPFAGRAWC
jgi:non-ribosomal peptide synthetase component F